MFSNTIVFTVITLTILLLTALIMDWANSLFHRISEKLTSVKPGSISAEATRARNMRDKIVTTMQMLLVASVGLLTLVVCLNVTILNPDFVAAELKKFDISAIGTELLSKQYADQIGGTLNKLSAGKITQAVSAPTADEVYSQQSIEATLTQLGPELTDEVNAAVYQVEDYISGKQASLDAVIPLRNLKEALKQNLTEAVTKSPPIELQNAPQSYVQAYIDAVYQAYFGAVPDEIKLSSDTATGLFITSIHGIRRAAMLSLKLPLILLLLSLLLVVGIIVIHRDFKSALWTVGITLGISGALDFLYSFIATEAGMHTASLKFLPALNLWFIQIVVDVLANMKAPIFILLGVGLGLFVLSLFWVLRRRKPNPNAA